MATPEFVQCARLLTWFSHAGGILGIALFEGAKGINHKLLTQTVSSWIMTMVVMGLATALIFSQGVYAPNRFVELKFQKNMTMTYHSICNEYYNCGPNQYLKGCGILDGDERTYHMGKCADCATEAAAKCKIGEYLKGCGRLSSGKCTNCTTVKCESGQTLSDCGGASAGVCK
jgi:hypothetical protein